MKIIPSILFPLALFAGVLPAAAEVSPVSIRVEQAGTAKHEKFKHTQERSLRIFLTNSSPEDFAGLRVEYFHFARGVKNRDITILDRGEVRGAVKSHATETVDTPKATAVYVEEHTEGNPIAKGKKAGAGGGKGGKKKAKKVPESGRKLVGCAVRVFSGDRLLCEYFSEPSLRERVK